MIDAEPAAGGQLQNTAIPLCTSGLRSADIQIDGEVAGRTAVSMLVSSDSIAARPPLLPLTPSLRDMEREWGRCRRTRGQATNSSPSVRSGDHGTVPVRRG